MACHFAHDRGDMNYLALSAHGHMSGHRPRDMKNTLCIDSQNFFKGFGFKIHQARAMLNTRIINNNINAALFGFIAVNCRLCGGIICNIKNQFRGRITSGLKGADCGGCFIVIPAINDDFCASMCQPACKRKANAAPCTRDQRGLSC